VRGWRAMIHLTRLNNTGFTINSDLIKFVEQSPDTVITLLNGEKILVREPLNEIVGRIVEFRRRVLSGLSAWSQAASVTFPGLPDSVPTHSSELNNDESEGQRRG
jgi:flagellar protein FlbD